MTARGGPTTIPQAVGMNPSYPPHFNLAFRKQSLEESWALTTCSDPSFLEGGREFVTGPSCLLLHLSSLSGHIPGFSPEATAWWGAAGEEGSPGPRLPPQLGGNSSGPKTQADRAEPDCGQQSGGGQGEGVLGSAGYPPA